MSFWYNFSSSLRGIQMPEEIKGFTPPGQQTIKTDGVFGPQTAAYIKFFQEDTNRRISVGGAFLADRRIDPLDGKLRGSQKGGLLTMAIRVP
jgi:hypothetical protein